ncbi:MAG: ATP-binding protein, partial [Candidatus Methanomethylophilaceae archaeon]|nr:ATP-binding protein [Candidatus Methanomethylophilaceae archaeon]
MFVGREKELKQLQRCLSQNRKEIVLIYGKRRVGKTTLIKEAAEKFNGTVIFFEGIKAKTPVNLHRLAQT